jgi:NADH:ubiquinone oxidoreductase subunit F (NADH-binding)/Pyruvate/2-oxoacid:ferredoxin oxidoreductase delta subunit/(2Fe-2S) ferredoxin
MTTSLLLQPCCAKCTHSPGQPCPDLISCLTTGPICHTDKDCSQLRARRLAEVRRGGDGAVLFVGAGTCGRANGALRIMDKTRAFLAAHDLPVTMVEVGCVGYCQREVFMDLQPAAGPRLSYCDLSPENADEFLDTVFVKGELKNRFLYGRYPETSTTGTAGTAVAGTSTAGAAPVGRTVAEGSAAEAPAGFEDVPLVADTPFFARQTRVVLDNCGLVDPASLDAALAAGGFAAAASALTTMTPQEVCNAVMASGLRGRGGAGFPTGQKWKVALDVPAGQKYLICNADEGDPGAFMDRAVLEGDPFRVIEGMLIAAYAIGATKGYVYCRAEYPLAIARLQDAIMQCRKAGLLGANILGSLTDFDITIKQGAGAFVCGEETAILASIEGGRGMPRPRPPYPAVAGLHGKPTVLNNVETLANVPGILRNGPEWFKELGIGDAAGTKVFALSGRVRNTGLVEVPVGIPLREVVYTIGGGAPEGHQIKAVQLGGPSGGCIPDALLDVPADYGRLQELGAMMGSGGMVVMDERTCMVDVAKYFMEFIRNESCGKCTPCREGTTRMHEILLALTERPVGDEMRRLERFRGLLHLEELAETIKDTSLCGLGQSAANPVLSTLRFFRDEYEAHIMEDRCPAGVCQGLRTYQVDNASCIGCMACKKNCPSGAIVGERKNAHYIVVDKCLGCGACMDACPKHSISLVA